MLDLAVNLKLGTIADLGTKLSQVAHNALKLGSGTSKIVDQRTKVRLLIRIKPVTNNPQAGFQGFKVVSHSVAILSLLGIQCNHRTLNGEIIHIRNINSVCPQASR